VKAILAPFRRIRRWILGPSTQRISDLAGQNRALEHRVDELHHIVEEALVATGRTGRQLRRLELRLASVPADSLVTPAAENPGNLTVSVVIVTYNRAASLHEVLLLLRQLDHPRFEVVVVNGPSTDESGTLLTKWLADLKIVECGQANIAVARNLGIARAAGDIVAFLDDDTYPDPAWLGELMAAFEAPDTAGVGGFYLDRGGIVTEHRHLVATRLGETASLGDFDPIELYASPYGNEFPVLPGGNSAYRRDALVAIGGFDEALEYGGEDGDVDLRLLEAGSVLRPAPAALVFHQALANDDRGVDLVMRSRYRYLRSKVYWAQKHARAFYSPQAIKASDHRVVEGLREERRRAVAAGLLDATEIDSLQDETTRAFHDGAALWEEMGGRSRDPGWFAAEPEPFRSFAHLSAGPTKRHECVVAGHPSTLPFSVLEGAELLAAAGHVIRIVSPSDGPRRRTVEGGVWRHRLPIASDAVSGMPAAELIAAEVRAIHAQRPLTMLRQIDVPASWVATLDALGLPPG
jgi:glycogen(starch) synthase